MPEKITKKGKFSNDVDIQLLGIYPEASYHRDTSPPIYCYTVHNRQVLELA